MRLIVIFLAGGILLLAGTVFLQIFLSKKENKWLGLILPITTFLFSIIVVMNIALFSVNTIQMVQEGRVITDTIQAINTFGLDTLLTIISVFVLYNIPTIVLFCIYIGCRGKLKGKRDIEKMNIQDLG